MKSRTKVVATIGPASSSVPILRKMMKEGLRVARLNFSHGDYKTHSAMIRNIRKAAKETGINVAILQDLQGPRIRVGELPKEGVSVKKNQKIALVAKSPKIPLPNMVSIPIQYEQLYLDVKAGNIILIEDGTIQLKVVKVRHKVIYAKVLVPGIIKEHKGINVPGVTLRAEVITQKDKKDIKFGQTQDVDYVALSFVKNAYDIRRLKQLIAAASKNKIAIKTKTIAKIERREALDNIDKILDEVDGIMVARGDLGLEIPSEQVPLWQKRLIEKCMIAAKPVIVATQMLDSMTHCPQPTRAEVSDVANAVIDHTDATMLSAESATGKYPLEAVSMMGKILQTTEKSKYDDNWCGPHNVKDRRAAVALSVCKLHQQSKAKAAIVYTEDGESARLIARHRPELDIIALTPNEKVQRQLALVWGVTALKVTKTTKRETMIKRAMKYLHDHKVIGKGDLVLMAERDNHQPAEHINAVRMVEVS